MLSACPEDGQYTLPFDYCFILAEPPFITISRLQQHSIEILHTSLTSDHHRQDLLTSDHCAMECEWLLKLIWTTCRIRGQSPYFLNLARPNV
ncbi:hypothetical protein PoB_001278200 [Plakobranchus ocellatus]|uniref:Uncharacterized protein n=1 Tax=Plakobranchus ocellatus TaxID=259542 RepID=A0AAV3YUX6_9GAST|nr:hypothetical protein PoB_001278200 [Plakobranchus ocellatus]